MSDTPVVPPGPKVGDEVEYLGYDGRRYAAVVKDVHAASEGVPERLDLEYTLPVQAQYVPAGDSGHTWRAKQGG